MIRFSWESKTEVERDEDEAGMLEWDWIGDDSPMLADKTEPEWVLEKLCDSLDRFIRRTYGSFPGDGDGDRDGVGKLGGGGGGVD